MTELRQAAEMALEALEEAETQNDSIEKWDRHALAIEALRQALAQSDCEWVNLTDNEIAKAVGSPIDEVYLADFRKVEAKLKEKNNAK